MLPNPYASQGKKKVGLMHDLKNPVNKAIPSKNLEKDVIRVRSDARNKNKPPT